MAELHVISALKDKRATISGELLVLEAKMDNLYRDLAALDRTLRMFDPDAHPQGIPPIIRRKVDPRFRQGTWSASVLRILREAGKPLAVREVAALVAKQFSLPYEKPTERVNLDNRIRIALKKPRQGVVSEWNGSVMVWRVADTEETEADS
jgi:hypothetical protein